MLKSGLILALTAAALCGCAQPQKPFGPPAPHSPAADRVTPPPPPIGVIRPRV